MSHIRHAHLYIVSAEDVTVDQFRAPAQHTGSRSRMIHVGTPTGLTPAKATANVRTRLNLRVQTLP